VTVKLRTFQDQEVVLVAFEKALQLYDAWVVDTAHDLYFLQNIGTLQVSPVTRKED
jgi:hypothetical protein